MSPETLDRYISAALSGARSRAAEIAAAEVVARDGEHAPAVRLVGELLAPAQVQVGEMWLDRRCSVGDEHAATFVTESVLSSLTVGFEPNPTAARSS